MTTTTSKSTTKKTGTKTKTSSKPLETILLNSVWKYQVWNWKGEENIKILIVSTSNNEEKFLREQGYKNIKTISPNNICDIENEREYHVAITIYPNKYIKEYEDREEFYYDIYERVSLAGGVFTAISNKSGLSLDCNIIEERETYKWYVM